MSVAAPHHVIGTAGHIDHGKTSLVKALTGIDTDRLKEEKERGITIELGFAHLPLPRSGVVGVVDVPGHERFVRTMVAGAVGIDLVVLVVAADEGVMPQTREHLDICGLLGIRRGLVALTKADLVDRDLLELATLDVRDGLRGTFLEKAPILPCSAVTRAGLPELVGAIDDLLQQVPGRDPGGLLRLPVDRVFTIKGFGTVATGTLFAGQLHVGDEMVPLPGAAGQPPAKVRGLQVHGLSVDVAVAGQRTAVNLNLPRESLLRGETLVRPGTVEAGNLLDVRIHYLPTCRAPLRRRSRVLLHAGTAQRLASITLLDCGELPPGGSALAQIHLTQPLFAQPGDRFILRGFSMQKNHGTTLGGGVVLRTLGARQRRGSPTLSATLRAVEQAIGQATEQVPDRSASRPSQADQEILALEVARAGVSGRTLRDLLMRVPLTEKRVLSALPHLTSARRIVGLGGGGTGAPDSQSYASRAAVDFIKDAVLRTVADHHAREPMQPGFGRETLQLQLGPLGGDRDGIGEGRPVLCPPRLLGRALDELGKEERLVVDRDLLRLPGHDPKKSQAEKGLLSLAERAMTLFREAGLSPPRPEEAAVSLSVPLSEVKQTLDLLCRQGSLLRIKDLFFDKDRVSALRERLVSFLRQHREITPGQWKDLVGATRKFTIPLAEYFDAEKITLRVGEVRRLRG